MEATDDTTTEVEDLYQKLTLEEDGGALEYEKVQEDNHAQEWKWCIIGRFLTDRSLSFTAMKSTLASIWRPVKGVRIQSLGSNLYVFQFYHELDVHRVIHDGSWTFEQHLLVMAPIEFGMNPQQVPLFSVQFWVQVYHLPSGFMSEKVAKDIGNFIGCFVEADPNNFVGGWRTYMRIGVTIDIRKHLKRRMKIKKVGETWSWANFKYEKLPSFCFFCGILGHTDKFCEKFFDYPNKSVEKLFGTWLRAPNKKPMRVIGDRWLRSDDSPGNGREPPTAREDSIEDLMISQYNNQTHGYNLIHQSGAGARKKGGMDGQDSDVRGKDKLDFGPAEKPQIEFLIVVDPKIRRIEDDMEAASSDIGPVSQPELFIIFDPKNLDEAGLGIQARQALCQP